jgi:hypothetical protein
VKAYFVITGLLFGLLAVAHIARTVVERSRLSDPGFIVEGPGIAVVAGALSIWAWRLLWISGRK